MKQKGLTLNLYLMQGKGGQSTPSNRFRELILVCHPVLIYRDRSYGQKFLTPPSLQGTGGTFPLCSIISTMYNPSENRFIALIFNIQSCFDI